MRSIGSFGVALLLMLTGAARAEKVNWNDYVEKGPTKYTQAAKNANTQPAKTQPAKAQPAVRTTPPKQTRAVAKAPAKAAPKAKAPVRKK